MTVLKRDRETAEKVAKENLKKVGGISLLGCRQKRTLRRPKQRVAIARAASMDLMLILS